MGPAAQIAVGAWGIWIVFNLLMVGLAAAVLPVRQAHFDGFRVRLPTSLPFLLSQAEIDAVVCHEHGHRHHLHVWANLLLSCLLLAPGPQCQRRQELEADDYAAERGHALVLASALRKLSRHPDDISRAERLERL